MTIIEVGAEGGSIRLVGMETGTVWRFQILINEAALHDLLSEEDQVAPVDRKSATTWSGALRELDRYPWPGLHPLSVHRDFVESVAAALRTRLKPGDGRHREDWSRVLGMKV